MSDLVRYDLPTDPAHPSRPLVVIGPLVAISERAAIVTYDILWIVITPGVCSEFFAFRVSFPREQAGAPVSLPLESEPVCTDSHAQPL